MEQFGDAFRRLTDGRGAPRVLDAGCGSHSNVDLPPGAYVVGVDISAQALDHNALLDERIVGDLETVELDPRSFDLIVCWDVLEHLPRPERALAVLVGALTDDGLLVLGLPNVRSVKGVVTKYTPYGFHRWIYRRAGTVPSDPHRTFLRSSLSLEAVTRWAVGQGLEAAYTVRYEAPIQARLRGSLRLTGRLWTGIGAAVHALSLGRLATDDTDFVVVFSRPQAGGAPRPEPTRPDPPART